MSFGFAGQRRPGGPGESGALVHVKRPRMDLVAVGNDSRNKQLMQSGEVLSARFSPTGGTLASASFDRLIYLWNVYGDCENFAVMKGHSSAIMEIHYSTDGSMLFSASTDKTGAVWDCEVGERVKKLKGHTSFVNTCCPSRRGVQHLATGSDDGTIKLWDIRKKGAAQTFNSIYQVTAVCFNDTGDQIISGGLDNELKVWDLRHNGMVYSMSGHSDTITGLKLSPNGNYILSNSMDNTVRIWDARPFAPAERQLKVFLGHQHSFEKNLLRCSWSPDGRKIAAGSADRFVYVWDTVTQRILYKLPGHLGSINDVDFHPNEPISLAVLEGSSPCPVFFTEFEGVHSRLVQYTREVKVY